MNTLMRITLAALMTVTLPALVQAANYPQTNGLNNELATLKKSHGQFLAQITRIQGKIQTARNEIRDARKQVKEIQNVDDQLTRIHRELESLGQIPALKMLGVAARGMNGVRDQVKRLRIQAERLEREVLIPTDEKLVQLQKDVASVRVEVTASNAAVIQAEQHIVTARNLLIQRGNRPKEVQVFEAASQTLRKAVTPVNHTISDLIKVSNGLESQADAVVKGAKAFTSLNVGLQKLKTAMKPFNDMANEMSKVMTKRLEINLFGKKHGLSLRQVINGPKNIAAPILMPLNAMADKLIDGVMKKYKLQLKAPAELQRMTAALNQMKQSLLAVTAKWQPNTNGLKTWPQAVQQFAKR